LRVPLELAPISEVSAACYVTEQRLLVDDAVPVGTCHP
jgi:hypothetical protein